MKKVVALTGPAAVVALAMTWDGTRWPSRSLSPAIREFLRGRSRAVRCPSVVKMAELFARDAVREIRICWVPRLKGGEDVLSGFFRAPDGLRIGFRVTKSRRFGDVLGVVYRRKARG